MEYRKLKGAKMKKPLFKAMRKYRAAAVGLTILIGAGAATSVPIQISAAANETPRRTTQGSRFVCNMNALSTAERARHRQLTEKLISSRTAIVETEKGYEFQYSPSTVTLAEVAAWVVNEGKCCPFFDFHIDLEQQAHLICLRLTGEQGVKPFIRSEFQVPGK
jgi:hypothetical protein